MSKKFSVVVSNIDRNTYRAYKHMGNGKYYYNLEKTDLHALIRSELKGVKYPFGLKEDRFRWQDNDKRGQYVELNGTSMIKTKEPERHEYVANVKHCFFNKSQLKKYVENKNSIRTLIPESSNTFDENHRKCKFRVASATGSIANLLECTQDVEIPRKKVKHQECMIFKPEAQKIKQRRRSVDVGSVAGRKNKQSVEDDYVHVR
jgi:hypothetical protein